MLMNNARLTTRLLPANITAWDKFTEPGTPFHLSGTNGDLNIDNSVAMADAASSGYRGPVAVERSVARFDFKDGSELKNNTYSAVYFTSTNGNVTTTPIVNVQLQKMCLVNMSNSFYYVPRVSNNGQGQTQSGLNDFAYCGVQLPWNYNDKNGLYSGGNYVVGPYFSNFGSMVRVGFSNYFNYPFFEDNGSFNNMQSTADRWDVMLIDDVLKNGADDNSGNASGGYKIWRYVTENVIPADETRQVNGISTGVVFKGRLLGTEQASGSLEEAIWEKGNTANIANCLNGKSFTYLGESKTGLTGSAAQDPILYYLSGRLYMGWRHIRQAAIQSAVSIDATGKMTIDKSGQLYKAVFGNGPIPPTSDEGDGVVKNLVYVTADGKEVKIADPSWSDSPVSSAYAAYIASPNYFWEVWMQKGRPVDGDGSSTNVDPSLENMRAAITGAGTKIYQSSVDSKNGAGYYCYYYYWVRHNDNENPGVMGPMEFDVVRNNVYKISVKSIAGLGHPRIPENDPDRPRPQTPDESADVYFDVTVEILPWAVRNNYVDFD
ncbi:MAG: Mfa1 fimbrilin C-terminal domain-containing protein [Muribaculaceae bacterium]|nr:Mfa1 fimbrilin C-terminal domain-containing protein [Muribaculaceae bacterium]